MNRTAEVPAPDALLCEACGYILTGLPREGACPECGRSISESLPVLRTLPEWELSDRPAWSSFWATTRRIIFRPTNFYRTLLPRGDLAKSAAFARRHEWVTSAAFGVCLAVQLRWMLSMSNPFGWRETAAGVVALAALPALAAAAWFVLRLATNLAIRSTNWEASYRGLRLPVPVVRRAMHYHSAHYLPVALIALLTVCGFHGLVALDALSEIHGPRYLYILSAEVFFAAAYLFKTYWLGMRKLMYANG